MNAPSPKDGKEDEGRVVAAGLSGALPAILEGIGDGFLIIDANCCVVFINQRACELMGVAREAAAGRVLWQGVPQMSGTDAERRLRGAVAARQLVGYEIRSPLNGRWLWVRVWPLGNDLTGVYWYDISESKRAT
ncbi:MAG TPA: PAS domain-containing protein, partial [Stellaceae bacterium]|nr:PAS domain-containing protein [Stellaceae bacterium]